LALAFSRILNVQMLRLVLLLVITALQCPSLFGQTPRATKLQVGHDTWTFKDGAPENIAALAQTTDGFLWLATPSGLFRFDGIRFEPFNPPLGDQLLSTNVFALFAPPDGGLWIGYLFGGFSFLRNGRLTNYAGEAASSGTVRSFAQDRDGIVWAGTTSGLWRFDHSFWQHIGAEWNAPDGPVDNAAFDRNGILWVIQGKTLLYLLSGSKQFQIAEKNLSAGGFTLDADRAVLTTPIRDHRATNLTANPDARVTAYPVLRNKSVQLVDRTNSLWTAPDDDPVVIRLAPSDKRYSSLDKVDASKSETFNVNLYNYARLVDREGNIWFGSVTGLDRFFYSPFIKQELPKPGGLISVAADDKGALWIGSYNDRYLYHVSSGKIEMLRKLCGRVSCLYRAPDRSFWFGTEDDAGFWHLVGHNLVPIDLPREVVNQSPYIQAMTSDQSGGLWVSFGRKGLYRLADGVWTPFGGHEDLPKTGVVSEFTDSLGRVWFGYTKNQLALLEGDRVQVLGPGDGLRVGNITSIYGRGSEIWIGGEFGLQQFDHGRFHNITAVDDQLLRGISGIVETADGDLWLNGLSGIFYISRAEISEALKNPAYQVKGEHFGRRTGLPGSATQLRPLPTAIEGSDGRLWFAVTNGVVWLDPTHSQEKVPPPPIAIQSVTADDKSYEMVFPLTLPARTSSVQINYSAVSLSNPEAIRFRYKLQEIDKDWHEVGTASPVTYRNLSPGSYHFSVAASDANGVWSDNDASVDFTILPTFYQTTWFLALWIAGALSVLYLLYVMRLKQMAHRVRGRMQERLDERERIARDLHDTFLQSVQGLILKFDAVAKQIPSGEPARQTMEKTLDRADQVLAEGRDRVRNLRATAVLLSDLPAAFQRVAEESPQCREATFKTVVEGGVRELHPMVLEESYCIGREAIVNALIHSEGLNVEVEITYGPRQFRLRVRDDGRGFDPEILEEGGRPDHWGLQGMRERAQRIGAQLELWSRPGTGTEVELIVPGATAYQAVGTRSKRTWFRRSSGFDL
jgi:signal transduction histidine kinase/ligand-binding sensor domain-containing protein